MTIHNSTTYHHIEVSRRGPVTTITLNRPAVLNALHPPMHFELQAAFDDFAGDKQARACILRAAGERAFCVGSDLKFAAALPEEERTAALRYPAGGYGGLAERHDLAKPIIAAVNGLALGGGFELVLACDIVIASSAALFGLPEPLVGQVALGGGLHRLARQIGVKRALGMILTSEPISAAQAERFGLVNEVVEPGDLDAAAQRWAIAILRGAPSAIEASKEAVYRGLDEPSLAEAIARQGRQPAFARWAASEDVWEGPRAFAEKRRPRWMIDMPEEGI